MGHWRSRRGRAKETQVVRSIKPSLQMKVFTIFLLMGAALLAGTYIVLHQFLLPTFHQLELEHSRSRFFRAEQAIEEHLLNLKTLDTEYGLWDATYQFIQNPAAHPEFIPHNAMQPRYWARIGIQMVLFFDRKGKLAWGELTDPDDGHELPLAKNLGSWAKPRHPLVTQPEENGSTAGFLRLPAGLMLVAASPILKNDGSGPPEGSVVMGRFVTPALASTLGHNGQDEINFYPLRGSALPQTVRRSVNTLLSTPSQTVSDEVGDKIYVRRLIRDVSGDPVGLIEVGTPRKLATLGLMTETTALKFFAVVIVLFILTGWILLRRWVISPVLALQQAISGMRESRKLTQVSTRSDDEIGALAREFNHLVKALGSAWKELESSRDQALQLAKVKGDFLASMSHEIRTPMNGVLGMAELMNGTKLDARQKELLQGIRTSGELLLSVINDILDFSRMESGKLQLDDNEFDLLHLLEETLDLLAMQAQSKGLELLLSVPPEIGHEFFGDANRLRQILINLVGNAIKFTHKGQVLVSVSVERGDPEQPLVLFEVADTGIGIDQNYQKKIFEAFSQADTSLARRYGGTGLGLSICSQLVGLMGGEIGLKSERGKGSVFWFRVPLRATGKPVPTLELPPQLEDVKALVVDDNRSSRELLERCLARWEIQADLAPGGEEALAKLKNAAAQKQPYTLLLLDWHMPEMDGPELVARIDADESITRPRIIMLGHASSREQAQGADDLGIDLLLSKPVHRTKLFDGLKSLFAGARKNRTVAKTEAPPATETLPGRASVLLVEDNIVNQDVARFMLEACGCAVTVIDNGADAVLLQRTEPFDLVLMDCSMPGMDGFEATRRIRENEKGRGLHIPIIALTANVLDGVREHCLDAGMDDYLPKPFSKSELLAKLQAWLPAG